MTVIKPNLIVSGLTTTSSLESLVTSIVAQSLHNVNTTRIRYVAHSVSYQGEEHIAEIELEFHPGCMEEFCDALMQPNLDSELLRLSKWGLLGFSPVEATELADYWHMAVMKSTFVYGLERMKELQIRGLSLLRPEALPVWFKVANFVGGCAIEMMLICNPALGVEDIESIVQARQRRTEHQTRLETSSISAQTATNLLLLWAANNSRNKTDEEKKVEAKAAFNEFFSSVERLQRSLQRCLDEVPTPMKSRRILFTDAYKLTTHAYNAFVSVEELMRAYTKLKYMFQISSASAFFNTMANCYLASSFWAARNVSLPPPAWYDGIGRSIGLITGPTNAEIAKAVAKNAYWNTAWAGVSVVTSAISFGYNVKSALNAKWKEDQCEQLANYIFQCWLATAETNTLLRWVHTTNSEFVFNDQMSGRAWEDFIRDKLNKATIQDNWKSPLFLKMYLKSIHNDLGELKTKLQASSQLVFT